MFYKTLLNNKQITLVFTQLPFIALFSYKLYSMDQESTNQKLKINKLSDNIDIMSKNFIDINEKLTGLIINKNVETVVSSTAVEKDIIGETNTFLIKNHALFSPCLKITAFFCLAGFGYGLFSKVLSSVVTPKIALPFIVSSILQHLGYTKKESSFSTDVIDNIQFIAIVKNDHITELLVKTFDQDGCINAFASLASLASYIVYKKSMEDKFKKISDDENKINDLESVTLNPDSAISNKKISEISEIDSNSPETEEMNNANKSIGEEEEVILENVITKTDPNGLENLLTKIQDSMIS